MIMIRVCILLCVALHNSSAFSPNSIGRSTTTTRSFLKYETKLNIQTPENGDNDNITDRRKALSSIATATATATATILATTSVANAVDDDLTRGGVQLTPFNGLTFNYRGGTTNNGLDASTLNEPSIPYVDFLKRLDNDEVEFVEFLAPNGDAAYVTFKAVDGEDEKMKPIRIGEGYPIEDPEGWSSPAFVVKSVKKKGVPYKFTVPALARYK